MDANLAQLANDRFEIADTLHRFAYGLDHNDPESMASALTEDCRFDFTPAGRKLGLNFPLLNGRQQVLQGVLSLIGPLDTSHTASNLQIHIEGDTATLRCYVMSQHFMPRQGCRPDADFALLMNRYACELLRDGGNWRFRSVVIDNAWAQGDPQILNALAEHERLRARRHE